MTLSKSEYLLDPAIIFLNHGSIGACPRVVFETYQHYQKELEWNPVTFNGGRLMGAARSRLAAYLGADANDLVFFTNPTTAFNMAARSLELKPGDEILTTELEYPAMERTWAYLAHRSGARYIHQPTALPIQSAAEFVDAFWAGVNSHTRVVFLSHITSFTALILPVQEICRRARAAGIISIIDGAHAPSQIPLNLSEVGADIYVGACHKWLSAPKGAGFLYARPEAQSWLKPLIISGGWPQDGEPYLAPDGRSWLVTYNEGQGTRDYSAFLSVPAAIEFQEQHDWAVERQRCHALASATRQRINALTGERPLCPDSSEYFSQMASVYLPTEAVEACSRRLWEEFRIVTPIIPVQDRHCLRFSIQAYNDENDADRLVGALQKILKGS
jgi:isopenicillin-N epimerase